MVIEINFGRTCTSKLINVMLMNVIIVVSLYSNAHYLCVRVHLLCGNNAVNSMLVCTCVFLICLTIVSTKEDFVCTYTLVLLFCKLIILD